MYEQVLETILENLINPNQRNPIIRMWKKNLLINYCLMSRKLYMIPIQYMIKHYIINQSLLQMNISRSKSRNTMMQIKINKRLITIMQHLFIFVKWYLNMVLMNLDWLNKLRITIQLLHRNLIDIMQSQIIITKIQMIPKHTDTLLVKL